MKSNNRYIRILLFVSNARAPFLPIAMNVGRLVWVFSGEFMEASHLWCLETSEFKLVSVLYACTYIRQQENHTDRFQITTTIWGSEVEEIFRKRHLAVQFLSFSCSFWVNIFPNDMLTYPFSSGVIGLPSGKSWIRHRQHMKFKPIKTKT